MGSNWIWLTAAVAFGLVCGSIYAWYRRKSGATLRKWMLWSAAYALVGWFIYRMLRIIFGS